jgi:hypothetical protein
MFMLTFDEEWRKTGGQKRLKSNGNNWGCLARLAGSDSSLCPCVFRDRTFLSSRHREGVPRMRPNDLLQEQARVKGEG